jgi:hypothetical protein
MDRRRTLLSTYPEKLTSINEGLRRRSRFWEVLLVLFVLIAPATPHGSRQFTFGLFSQCGEEANSGLRNPAFPIEVEHGAVASESVLCSELGVEVLKEGGNAVDAAVATTFCVGVVNMFS